MEIHSLTTLEARSRLGKGWFLLLAGQEGSVPGLSPWYGGGFPLMSSCGLPSVCVSVSTFPL